MERLPWPASAYKVAGTPMDALQSSDYSVRWFESVRMRTVHHPPVEELSLPSVLYALSDPVRLEIVRRLAAGDEHSCGTFDSSISKSTLSHHLKVLRECGITSTRLNGTSRLVSLRRGDLDGRFPGLLGAILGVPQAH